MISNCILRLRGLPELDEVEMRGRRGRRAPIASTNIHLGRIARRVNSARQPLSNKVKLKA
jgi:hypothetical protein